jgi:chitin disaccharide deacetylase
VTVVAEPGRSRTHDGVSRGARSAILLCADDYAISGGVSRAIVELAAAQRLSATSALVTTARWLGDAAALLPHRGHLSIGLHLNLTLGRPLGPMPRFAPAGAFPTLGRLATRTLLRAPDTSEIKAEIARQLGKFEEGLGFPPDHIDGHQHVHVLPGVRQVLLAVIAERYPRRPPLVRVPTSLLRATFGPGPARSKAAAVALLGLGFAGTVRKAGLPANDTFAGFSRFDTSRPYARELRDALRQPGRRHIVMCHSGHPDAELARLDSIVARRGMEYEALMREPDLPQRIWHPSRESDGPPLDWSDLGDPA